MQILYVGELNPSSNSFMIMQAMRDSGHEVTAISTDISDTYGNQVFQADLISRVRWKIGFPCDYTGANKSVLAAVRQKNYELLWVTKSLMLRPDTLLQARQLQPSMRIVMYVSDNLTARHHQSYYLMKSIDKYDVIFSANRINGLSNKLLRFGAKRIVTIDFSYDKNHHHPIAISEEEKKRFGAQVGFIGTFEQDRADHLLYLAQKDIPIRVWGNSWPASWRKRHPNLRIEGYGLPVQDYVKVLCSTDINLGFLRKANHDHHTCRSLEIPACGAFMLAERTDDHLRLFVEGKEAEFFDTLNELEKKVRYYLAHADERRQIAAAGRKRCLDSGYSFHDRLPSILHRAMEEK
ncbi:MAG: glycosyltransferase family 1 protein [Nitrospiraceae bacterium]|nr:MAG: glycosyltransferase family 1 protein [Nitrospiraceae bacterium]